MEIKKDGFLISLAEIKAIFNGIFKLIKSEKVDVGKEKDNDIRLSGFSRFTEDEIGVSDI